MSEEEGNINIEELNNKVLQMAEALKAHEETLAEKDAYIAKLERLNNKLVDSAVASMGGMPERHLSPEEEYNQTIDTIAQAIRDKYIGSD